MRAKGYSVSVKCFVPAADNGIDAQIKALNALKLVQAGDLTMLHEIAEVPSIEVVVRATSRKVEAA